VLCAAFAAFAAFAASLAASARPALAAWAGHEGQGGRKLETRLLGANEVGGGDPDGKGEAEVVLDSGQGTVCFEIEAEDIAPVRAAHIHAGAAGANGPVVVDFAVAANGLSGCVTADFPAGALRGQLSK